MSVFKKTLPLMITVFINKCGTMGLSLIPMLLVRKHLSVMDSSLIMSIIKFTSVGGSFIGGYFCDIFGMKFTLLLSFALAGLGLGLVPFFSSIVSLTFFSSVSQLGNSMFGGPMRLLIADWMKPEEQQESWGWFRLSNNVGQIFSYGLGSFFAGIGITTLMYFDCMTSLLAVIIGFKIIPKEKKIKEKSPSNFQSPSNHNDKLKTFIIFAIVTGGFSCMYEMFMVAMAANSEIHFGYEGVKIFSQIFLVNTVLCALVAVPATKYIKNPRVAFPLGIIFMGIGSAIAFHARHQLFPLFLGTFVVTLGEIYYTALATYVLIRITPQTKMKGSLFGFGLVFQPVGRIIGAGLAFPLIVHGTNHAIVPLLLTIFVLGLAFYILPEIMEILKSEGHKTS